MFIGQFLHDNVLSGVKRGPRTEPGSLDRSLSIGHVELGFFSSSQLRKKQNTFCSSFTNGQFSEFLFFIAGSSFFFFSSPRGGEVNLVQQTRGSLNVSRTAFPRHLHGTTRRVGRTCPLQSGTSDGPWISHGCFVRFIIFAPLLVDFTRVEIVRRTPRAGF